MPSLPADRTVWCIRGWLPLFFAFCPSEKAWNLSLKKLGEKPCPYPGHLDGAVTPFKNEFGDTAIMVTIAAKSDARHRRDPGNTAGIIAHEAMHIYQHALAEMSEPTASREMEAYCVQFIVEQLFDAYIATRIVKRKKAK